MINRLFTHRPHTISVQAFRYVLAGGAACAVDYSTLIILTEAFKVYYLTSAAIAFILGALTSYALNVAWVFDKRAFKDRRLEISIFFGIAIVGFVLNYYCLLFFTETVKLHYIFSKVISTIIVAVVNFSGRKYILFH